MTWLYMPGVSTSSQSAPAAADSISASSWQCQALAASVWSKGKHSPSLIWSRRCKAGSYHRLLFGAMPEPSTAERGAAVWTASLAASRASLTAQPASGSPKKTSEISGPRRGGSSSMLGRGSSSSKTSVECSPPAGPSAYGESWGALVTRVRSDCSRRRRSARRTIASASSFSASATQAWPTPAAREYKGANSEEHLDKSTGSLHLDQLPNYVQHLWNPPEIQPNWPTPDSGVFNDSEEPESFLARQAEVKAKGINGNGMGMPLAMAVKVWPTPAASNAKQGSEDLVTKRKRNSKSGLMLTDVAASDLWMTPRTVMGPWTRDKGDPEKQRLTMEGQALSMVWSTPSVADTEGGRMSRSKERSNELLLNGQSAALSSHLDPTTSQAGETSSKERRSLNPRFVGWLMGWPLGWTGLALTSSACSATELSRFKSRMRFALSQLSLPEPPPVQQSLFG